MASDVSYKYDVIIAGAGPAGLHAAYHCQRLGLNALVLEEHAVIGEPNHCSGLISKNMGLFFNKNDIQGCIEHKVRGAIMYSPNHKRLKLEKTGAAAFVIDRAKFDSFLASRLETRPVLKSRIDALTVLDDRVVVKSGGCVFESNILLGCDGSGSFVRNQMQVDPKEMLNGLIAITKDNNAECSDDHVEMWFDKRICDGFLWKIPRGHSVEYGMLGTGAKFDQLKGFFDLSGKLERRGGIVPLGPPKTYFDRVLLVGDAAGMCKPWSGGGVVYSLTAAEIAARTIKQAKEAGDYSESFLRSYEQEWKKSFGSRIRTGMMARSLFKRMNNTQLNLAMAGMDKARFLMNKLDMDFLINK